VKFVEPTGGQTFVTVDLGGQPTMVLVSSEHDINSGETLTISAPIERTYVFDAATGQRISRN
jgi:multiple sugar transport system ATP-binding protein